MSFKCSLGAAAVVALLVLLHASCRRGAAAYDPTATRRPRKHIRCFCCNSNVCVDICETTGACYTNKRMAQADCDHSPPVDKDETVNRYGASVHYCFGEFCNDKSVCEEPNANAADKRPATTAARLLVLAAVFAML